MTMIRLSEFDIALYELVMKRVTLISSYDSIDMHVGSTSLQETQAFMVGEQHQIFGY